MGFFMNDTIPNDANVENVYEIFENVFKFYGKCLRQSIKTFVKVNGAGDPVVIITFYWMEENF